MLKIVVAGATALFVTAAPLAYAQQAASQDRLTAADWEHLTDARIKIVKAALQLMKMDCGPTRPPSAWPPAPVALAALQDLLRSWGV